MRRTLLLSAASILIVFVLAPTPSAAGQFDPRVCEGQNFPYFCAMLLTPAAFEFGSITWGDLDGDGLQDLVYSGNKVTRSQPQPEMQFLRNVGEFVTIVPAPDPTKPPSLSYEIRYAELGSSQSLSPSQTLWDGATLVIDLTGDGRLDIVATGRDDVDVRKTLIFRNTYGAQSEFELTQILGGISLGAMAYGDFDNDGDIDLILTGIDDAGASIVSIVRNDFAATGDFSLEVLPIDGVSLSSVDVGDFDGDLDVDVLLAGKNSNNDSVTRILRNENGTLIESGIQLPGLLFSRAKFIDVDLDGDLDVAISGARLSPFVLTAAGLIMENSGGSFSQSALFPGRYYGGLAVGDIDLDGTSDLVGAGGTQPSDPVVSAFIANVGGGNSFTEQAFFGGGLFGQVIAGDYDGDDDLDIMLYGRLSTGGNRLRAYRNDGAGTNALPTPPPVIQSAAAGSAVTLSWDPGSDAETSVNALSYNVRVGTSPGANDVVSSNARADGKRLLSARGNTEYSRSWRIAGLAPGTYYWSVQTIDSAYSGSVFSDEATFVIP